MQSIPLFRQLRYNIRDELIFAEDTFYVRERKRDGGLHHLGQTHKNIVTGRRV